MTSTNVEPESVGMSSARLERFHPIMRSYVDKWGYAGIGVAVARRGHVVFHAQYGERDREASLPMTEDTIFRIYSMTKPIVCVALMTLFEEGRIRLTDPVSRYLPAFGDLKVMADDGSLAGLTRPVTVRHLLTRGPGSVGEHGWPGAANTYFWVDPEERLVGLLMTQYMLGYAAPEQDLRALVYQAIID